MAGGGEPTAEEKAATKFSHAATNGARPKSRVALRAASLAAAVGQNGYFDSNIALTKMLFWLQCCARATAQQLVKALVCINSDTSRVRLAPLLQPNIRVPTQHALLHYTII